LHHPISYHTSSFYLQYRLLCLPFQRLRFKGPP